MYHWAHNQSAPSVCFSLSSWALVPLVIYRGLTLGRRTDRRGRRTGRLIKGSGQVGIGGREREWVRKREMTVFMGLSVGHLYIIVTRLGQRAVTYLDYSEMDTDQEVSWYDRGTQSGWWQSISVCGWVTQILLCRHSNVMKPTRLN